LTIRQNDSVKMHIFYCANSFSIEDFNRLMHGSGDEIRFISLPCSGKADLLYLIKAFEAGADGVVIITCPKNECRYLQGNLRAPKRADEVNALLEEISSGKGRIVSINMDKLGMEDVVTKIINFRNKLKDTVWYHSRNQDSKIKAKAS
jgi:F420-non-reducing hydrogenase iron-sulfur subunit